MYRSAQSRALDCTTTRHVSAFDQRIHSRAFLSFLTPSSLSTCIPVERYRQPERCRHLEPRASSRLRAPVAQPFGRRIPRHLNWQRSSRPSPEHARAHSSPERQHYAAFFLPFDEGETSKLEMHEEDFFIFSMTCTIRIYMYKLLCSFHS